MTGCRKQFGRATRPPTHRRRAFGPEYCKRHDNPLARSPAHNRLPLERSAYVITKQKLEARVRQADLTQCSFSSRFR